MTKNSKRNTLHDAPLSFSCPSCGSAVERQDRALDFHPETTCRQCGHFFLLTEQLISDAKMRKGKWLRGLIERYGTR